MEADSAILYISPCPSREMSKNNEQVAISSDINHDACFDGSFDFARSEGCADRSRLYIPLANGTKEFRLITILAGEDTDRLLYRFDTLTLRRTRFYSMRQFLTVWETQNSGAQSQSMVSQSQYP